MIDKSNPMANVPQQIFVDCCAKGNTADQVLLTEKTMEGWMMKFFPNEIARAKMVLPDVVQIWARMQKPAMRFNECMKTFNHQFASRLKRKNLTIALALLVARAMVEKNEAASL